MGVEFIIENGLGNLNLGRGLTLACYRCHIRKIKKHSIPYDTNLWSKHMEQAGSLADSTWFRLTKEKANTSNLLKLVEEFWGKYSKNPSLRKNSYNVPLYSIAHVLIEKSEGYAGLGGKVKEAKSKGIKNIDSTFNYIAHSV